MYRTQSGNGSYSANKGTPDGVSQIWIRTTAVNKDFQTSKAGSLVRNWIGLQSYVSQQLTSHQAAFQRHRRPGSSTLPWQRQSMDTVDEFLYVWYLYIAGYIIVTLQQLIQQTVSNVSSFSVLVVR
jgi:hypothetical protein